MFVRTIGRPLLARLLLPVFLGGLTLAHPARAELWQGAVAHAEGGFALGFHAQTYGNTYESHNGFMTFSQFTYGQTANFQVEGRLGFGMQDLYVGLYAKRQLYESGEFAVAIHGGLRRHLSFFVDADLIVSYSLPAVEFYLAPILVAAVPNPFVRHSLQFGLIPGMDLRVTPHVRVYAEATAGVIRYYDSFSVGLRHFF